MTFYTRRIGLAFIGVLGLVSIARATLVVSDLGDTRTGTGNALANPYKTQGFQADIGGIIDSITVQLTFNAAAVTDGSKASVYILTAIRPANRTNQQTWARCSEPSRHLPRVRTNTY